MAVLYFKNPADGQWYPIIGSDVSGKADKTYVDNELAKKLDKAGDTSTDVMNLDDVRIGNVWSGTYKGIQQDGTTANDSAALLLGNSLKGGFTYLIGNVGGRVVIRPTPNVGSVNDFRFETAGLIIPQTTPTVAEHATRKDYVDAAGAILHTSVSCPSSTTADTQMSVTGGLAYAWGGCSTAGSNLYVPTTGYYLVGFSAGFSSASGGTVRLAGLKLNGATPATSRGAGCSAYSTPSANTSGWGAGLSATAIWLMNAGEYIGLFARQDSGATLATTGGMFARLLIPS